ncbi:MAG: SLC13 family permease [Pseudomonadota bacterium]
MTWVLDPAIHMWVAIIILAATMVSYAWERATLEMTSLALIVFLLVWFHLFPVPDADGHNRLNAMRLLSGFANPTLYAVLALLVMGQAMVQTGALNSMTRLFVSIARRRRYLSVIVVVVAVLAVSAFLNNTPVVIMFIPIMQVLAQRLRWSPSRLMMPLSFAAILGGATTLIGSSTNLLVSGVLVAEGLPAIGIFDITPIGVIMAAVGALYVVFVLPKLLPDRGGLADTLRTEGKQFIAEIDVTANSPLIGERAVAGQYRALRDVTVRLIQRGPRAILPPFEGAVLQAGDMLIVAATRTALTDALTRNAGFLLAGGEPMAPDAESRGREESDHVLAETMIAPASRMIDQTIGMVGFRRRFGCIVLGIQRRGRMTRQRMGEIRLQAGDVLLITGHRADVNALRANPDLVLMSWAIKELPRPRRAPVAAAVFAATVAVVASGILPLSVAALAGAVVMIASGCLNIRQATRALDRTIFLLVGATLALSAVMETTGAAAYLASLVTVGIAGNDPVVAMIALFAIVAVATNMLSNNACAVLFTPIAINLAYQLGVDPMVMAITVLFAANCSFITPIGYQTNLLVMGPGHYRFSDFARVGSPLALLMWLVFSLVAPFYFGLL